MTNILVAARIAFSHKLHYLSGIILLLALLLNAASAQTTTPKDGSTPLGLEPGAPAGAYSLSGFDNINLYNGSLNFRLPLLKVGGRGGAQDALMLPIERHWMVEHYHDDLSLTDFDYPVTDEDYDLLTPGYGPGVMAMRLGGVGQISCPPPPPGHQYDGPQYRYTYALTRLSFTGPDGTEYELRDQLTGGQQQPTNSQCSLTGFNRGRVFVSVDGSGATFISDSDIQDPVLVGGATSNAVFGVLLMRDGTRYDIAWGKVVRIRDRNGNTITFTYDNSDRVITVSDSLNRQVTIAYDVQEGGQYGLCDKITYNGVGGTSRVIRVSKTSLSNALRSDYTLQSYGALFPTLQSSYSTYFNPTVVSAVWLPDGTRRYQFRYNSYGELARVDLPTGGAFEYDFNGGFSNGSDTGESIQTGSPQIYRRVVKRRVFADGATLTSLMTYSRPESEGSTCCTVTTLGYVIAEQFDAAGTRLAKSQHYFYGPGGAPSLEQLPTQLTPWDHGKEYQTDEYDVNGSTILRRVVNSWAAGGGVYINPHVTQSVTTLMDANLVTQQTFSYDQFNNQTDVYEYAFGTGAAGTLVRRSHTDYLTTNIINGADYTSTSIHLRSLPTQQSVYDANGTEQARTNYEYDNYIGDGNHAPLLDRPGITGLDSSFTPSYLTRGNVTRVTNWVLSTGTPLYSYAQYDVAGNTVKSVDAGGNASQVNYADSFSDSINRNTFALPTSSTSAVPDPTGIYGSTTPLTSYSTYDFSTGLIVSQTDANNKTTTVQYNDVLDRPTAILRPDGGRTTYNYVDASQCGPYVETKTLLDTTGRETDAYVFFDGLGRSVRAFQYDGQNTSAPYLTADTQYDSLGRVRRTSNPYRSTGCTAAVNPSGAWTTTSYDALGRVTSVTTPDNATVSTSYSGNQVTVTDQAGKARRSVTDAQGRLVTVYEDPNGLNYQSSYSYDVLDNLRTVTQGSQTRTFVYDSLKRLTSASNPESGTITYQYDNNGNISQRTDARGIVTTYTYDNLNRNIVVNYSDNTHINHVYDKVAVNGRGRLYFSAYYPANGAYSLTEIDNYDAMGRPLYQGQYFWANGSWGTGYVTQRTYDYAGHVSSQTYPSGRTVNYSYDQAGRTSSFTGNLGNGVSRTYATSISYDEWNGLSREQFGTDIPLYHKERRNIRGQLWDMRLSTVNDADNWNRGAIVNYYSFQPGGAGASGTDNNGNILMQQHYVPNDDNISSSSFMQQNYGYDALNRMNWVGEYQNGTNFTGAQAQNLDRYGNRTVSSYFGTGINGQQFAVDTGTNRLGVPAGQAGVMQYDASGNLINDTYSGSGSRSYDAENRMVIATNNGGLQSIYTYDADGRRVRRNSYGQETWQVYGMDGELLAEYAAGSAPAYPQKEYGYRNGQLLITASSVVNLSLNKTATQSSTVAGADASRAVDGNTSGNWAENSVSHTDYQSQPWWQVDLGSSQSIQKIDVWNRTDCCGSRLTNFNVIVLDQNQNVVASYNTSGQAGTPTSITVNQAGRYVKVQLVGTDYLSLAEVQVWGGAAADLEWLVPDQLGTPRMIADKTGSLSGIKRHDYLPFGEELYAGTGGRTVQQGYVADSVREQFTGYERDNETGLDYAQARYFSSTQGRFTSPDPLYYQVSMAIDPQRFNLYSYVRNSPLKWVDTNGEKLYLRGNQDWLRTEILYQMAGGEEVFNQYFHIEDGQVLLNDGADVAHASSGVQELAGLVNASENYLFYAGTDGAEAASLFQGSTDSKGKLTSYGKKQSDIFMAKGIYTSGGSIVGTTGRGNGTPQPADLANGDPVFCVIAYNTNAVFTQIGVDNRYMENIGGRLQPVAEKAQVSGLFQVIKPVSFFLHEVIENQYLARIGVNNATSGHSNYYIAHQYAMRREAEIRKALNITGGFSGGEVQKRVPR